MIDRQRRLLLDRLEGYLDQIDLCTRALEWPWDDDEDVPLHEIDEFLDSAAQNVSSVWSLSKSLHFDLRRRARYHHE